MNEQTAVNNFYQRELKNLDPDEIQKRALKEFDGLVRNLRQAGVNVLVIEDNDEYDTPDSIFPNNWNSTHADGRMAIFPMFAENRRLERREDVLDHLEDSGFIISEVMDYSQAEVEGLFLEGTGSLLLDRQNRIAYCALSPRAHEELLIEFCEDFEYTPVVFHAYQKVQAKRELIYHTNVMMALTENLAVVCLSAIDDHGEKKNLIKMLTQTGKRILEISEEQVNQFAGNMLQVRNDEGQKYMVMSNAAFRSLSPDQISRIEEESEILHSDLSTIEACGGGSARCMMGEVFLESLG